jgi:hypothetical protein
MQETAVMVATLARDLLIHTAPERRHTLVQVEMPLEGTSRLAVVRSLMSGPMGGHFILASPQGRIMARLTPVRENTLQANRSITTVMSLSTSGLVRLSWIHTAPVNLNIMNRKQRRWRLCSVGGRLRVWPWSVCVFWPWWQRIRGVGER